jgi:hypothetical protein
MKKYINIIIAVALVTTITSCKKSFDELYINPNKPVNVPPSLLLNGILNNMYEAPFSQYERWDQYYLSNYEYYDNNRYDFGSGSDFYSTLKNVDKMEEEAISTGLPEGNVYSVMAKFFKAYFFTKMSLQQGDIPMSEAIEGITNLTPVYDAQKQVFMQAFSWLDSANTELGALIAASDANLKGDFNFGNDLSKWQKVVNAYRLRLLINLSKKADDPDLKIKQQFAAIISDKSKYPLMESADDNLQYLFTHPTNDYPMNPSSFGREALRYNSSATYVGLLTNLHDPRVFATMEPAKALVDAGKIPTNFDAFIGANPGEDLGTMYVKANAGQYSLINRNRYYETYTGEPSIILGFPEEMFNIAEGINRGWAPSGSLGTAEDYYKAGILASWAFYGIPESGTYTAYFYQSGGPGFDAVYNAYPIPVDFSNYYAQSTVKYPGNNAIGLTEILEQKYVALFRHSGLEAYYQFRRTGVPQFTTGPGTGNSGRIALRFQYSSNEKTANTTNYNAALDAQYEGNDDINGTMWLLK